MNIPATASTESFRDIAADLAQRIADALIGGSIDDALLSEYAAYRDEIARREADLRAWIENERRRARVADMVAASH